MNTTQNRCVKRKNTILALSALFVGLSLVPVIAQAEQRLEGDEAFDKLTKPVSKMEMGVGYVNKDSIAGDYTGLDKEGAYAIANIDLRGGAAYDSPSAARWRVKGDNLGLDSRRVDAEYGEQGKYRIKGTYDEITKLRSDTYQTPFQGVGTNNLTLPSTVRAITFGGATTNVSVPDLWGTNPNPGFAYVTNIPRTAAGANSLVTEGVLATSGMPTDAASSAVKNARPILGQVATTVLDPRGLYNYNGTALFTGTRINGSTVDNNVAAQTPLGGGYVVGSGLMPVPGPAGVVGTVAQQTAALNALPRINITDTGTAGMKNLAAYMQNVPIQTERKKGEAGLSFFVTPEIEFSAGYKEEHKEGNKILGTVFGSPSVAALLLPEPVDYNTRQFDASLAYNTKKAQFQLSYYGSLFENKNKSLAFRDPWLFTSSN